MLSFVTASVYAVIATVLKPNESTFKITFKTTFIVSFIQTECTTK
jgi:hypothetical protein